MLDTTVLLGVVMFTGTVLFLVVVILFARSRLVSSGNVTILINDDPDKSIEVPAGDKLLGTLASKGIFLASACGGGGTCAQCRCRVLEGGGSILSTEEGHSRCQTSYQPSTALWTVLCRARWVQHRHHEYGGMSLLVVGSRDKRPQACG